MKAVETNKGRSHKAGSFAEARAGLFRATLLFGAIAAALSMIVLPAADRHARQYAADRATDDMITGSIVKADGGRGTQQSSMLREDRSTPCLLFPDGTQKGAC